MSNKDLTFEQAFSRLEEIAELLESGAADLEQTIQLFEEASSLTKFCSKKIETAEEKLRLLTKDKDFQVTVEEE